jgi:hypothetical protein
MNSMLNRTLEKKLSPISNFIVALESPTWTMTQNVFGFGRGPPRWAQRAVKKPRFFENCWRCTTLEDHISGSSWPLWERVCLLERSYSLHLRKNMKIGIYRLLPILEPHQCLVGYNFFGPPGRIGIICGLWRDTHRLSKTSLKNLDTLRVFAKKNLFDFEPCKFLNFSSFSLIFPFFLNQWF